MPKDTITPDAEGAANLAEAISRIDVAMKQLTASGLKRDAIITLLHDSTGVGKRDIQKVLSGLSSLSTMYLDKRR